MIGLYLLECPILDNAANIDRHSKTVRPKNTTAFRRTQTVCMLILEVVVLLLPNFELLLLKFEVDQETREMIREVFRNVYTSMCISYAQETARPCK